LVFVAEVELLCPIAPFGTVEACHSLALMMSEGMVAVVMH
jgi:hypothetical protein